MATKASAVRYQLQPLRQRKHVVKEVDLNIGSSSFSSSESGKILSASSDGEVDHNSTGEKDDHIVLDEDSGSDSDALSADEASEPTSPSSKLGRSLSLRDQAGAGFTEQHVDHPSDSPECRPWYHVNHAILVALLAPIGNWLTGKDYVKDLILVGLLVFYLHNVIEAPWKLYMGSRPRRRAPAVPTFAISPKDLSKEKQQELLAASELRLYELFFLFLSLLSPFFGAAFLRYATTIFLGPESLSWFHTTLFILAAGIRPWSHLIRRVHERTADLHSTIHYPPRSFISNEGVQAELDVLVKRVTHLERALGKVKKQVVETVEEVYDYVEDAVEDMDRTVKKQDKRFDKQEGRVKEVEQTVEVLRGKGKQRIQYRPSAPIPNQSTKETSILFNLFPRRPVAAEASHPHSRSTSISESILSFPSMSSVPLDSIPEEDDQPPVKWAGQTPALPLSLASLAFSMVGSIITLPLRIATRLVLKN